VWAVDATPLLGVRTGVGMFCQGALEALGGRPDLDMAAFAVTWRRRHLLRPLVPAGVRVVDRPMAARPLQPDVGPVLGSPHRMVHRSG